MKKRRTHSVWMLLLLVATVCPLAKAQYMPVVFDKQYGDANQIQQVCPLPGDEAVVLGKEGKAYSLTWLDRLGEVVFSLPLTGFTNISEVTEVDNGCVLIVGQSFPQQIKNKKDQEMLSGRAVVVNRKGLLVQNIYAGEQGSELLKGTLLRDGSLVLSGTEPKTTGERQGILLKTDKTGKVLYNYKNAGSGYCNQFVVMGNATEYICAAFTGEREKEQTIIVRLDDKGKPYYTTTIPAKKYVVTGLHANINEGSVIITGNSPVEGGVIYKIRPEGDIVFGKTLIPSSQGVALLNHLRVARNGNILVGGSGDRGYYALLRNDGTALYSGSSTGQVKGLGMNLVTGESVVTTYDMNARRGTFVRIQSSGKAEFDRTIDGNFNMVRVDNNGEVLLLSSEEGRVCMFSGTGQKEFDRYVTDNQPTAFRQAFTTASGELMFLGRGSRLVKLGHGLYVSDVKITKPVVGTATAVFTVTLTGYATTKEGAPVPVTVDYATREVSATTTNNYIPVEGKLSFTPSRGSSSKYLVKQDIEVPIKANDLVEGVKNFKLVLSDVQQSYLVKPVGEAVIDDQQAVVKLVRTERGEEGSKDIVYELGLFKTDGTSLVNATGANIIVDGMYGEGTTDALDFDMGLTPRVVFANGARKSSFNVKTLEDTRYELPKTVIINFNKTHCLSGSNVMFDGEMLSCSGVVVDQPARLAIASLGDHRVNNNVVSGFFTVSLLRASDGALLTNATGSDIVVDCTILPDATAKEGKDFVFTNLHDLRISGDGNHSSTNVNGVILYTTDTAEKQVKLKVKSVKQPVGAQPVNVLEAESAADFTIRK
ncbi:Calx-beta domain-containing protein [Bacteroides sp. UBA939]|uniref:Calx-beta domain-containing protein n=1 Tax=Bacteroides sp. UBA939 TaxID=1946092 RepID=UPI0025C5D940|nr:Calx-beta domain-containing protein [Bacteroides sp. UBA939]